MVWFWVEDEKGDFYLYLFTNTNFWKCCANIGPMNMVKMLGKYETKDDEQQSNMGAQRFFLFVILHEWRSLFASPTGIFFEECLDVVCAPACLF